MKAICFDIEATDNEEILELSVYDFESDAEIFHNYFKPRNSRSWSNSQAVHHISPDMVADKPYFSRYRNEVQQLVDSADLLIGFAIENDIKYLLQAGIKIPENKPVAETKHWYWICRGKEEGLLLDAVPKLTVCANNMGITFPEEEAHSASTDTRNTLLLFKTLHKEFCEKEGIENGLSEKSLEILETRYANERMLFNMENAKGYITLLRKGDGYYIKNSQKPQESELSIKVESRFLAEHDIKKMFAKREDRQYSGFFHLKEKDIKDFLAYSNKFDPEAEKFYRHLYSKNRASKSRLNFRLT